MLLVAGCSFAWGDELEGFDNNPPTHWKHTYAHKLSKMLEVNYVNLAVCGNSNSKIFRDLTDALTSSKKLPTHIVVMWSAWHRLEFASPLLAEEEEEKTKVQRFSCMTQTSPERTHNLKKRQESALNMFYANTNQDKTGILTTLTYMVHLQWMCEQLGIKLVQGIFRDSNWKNLVQGMRPRLRKDWGPWQKSVNEKISQLKDSSRVGMNRYLDMYTIARNLNDIKKHDHPGEKAHEQFAELLYSIFKTQFENEK